MPEDDSVRLAWPDRPASEPAGFGRDAASEPSISQAMAATMAVIAAAAIAPRIRQVFCLARTRPAIATSARDSSRRSRAAICPRALRSFGRIGGENSFQFRPPQLPLIG